jgi:uncharacterized protein (TIGR04255 family)
MCASMTQRDLSLPEFENPPLVEVFLAVQFDRIEQLRTPQLGLLWQRFRDRFPQVEEKPPLDPMVEPVEPTDARQPELSLRIELLDQPPTPRLWFLDKEGRELVQVQRDRFVHNWRKVGEGDTYPRYERLRATFEKELRTFQQFLTDEGLGDFSPNLCEVGYINHIVVGGDFTHVGQLAAVVNLWCPRERDPILPQPDEVRFRARYRISSDEARARGHLLIEGYPGVREQDHTALLVLALAARGKPTSADIDGVLDFLDFGRRWVVQAFASITTLEMHRHWRRRDGGGL